MSGTHRHQDCTYLFVCLRQDGPFIVGDAHKDPPKSHQLFAPVEQNWSRTLVQSFGVQSNTLTSRMHVIAADVLFEDVTCPNEFSYVMFAATHQNALAKE